MIRVCIAGATGWAGRALAAGVVAAEDLRLVSAVSRSAAGSDLGVAFGGAALGVPVTASVAEALGDVDVLVDDTSHLVVGANVRSALERGVAVVVGASGLTAAEFAEIDDLARQCGVGVIAAGNFSLTAA
ncbi:MAG: 4-hydroxy-tetrahydrodipicolinate reductase, partial [Chloroflexota bacterium]